MIRAYDGWNLPPAPHHHLRSKLTPAQREEIAYLRGDGISPQVIAVQYGIAAKTVQNIAKRERP